MDLRRCLTRALAHLGLSAALAASVVSPALAHPATEVRAAACLDRTGFGIEWLDGANDAYDALPETDERVSLALVLAPQFEGPRPFHEPSGFGGELIATWDHTRFVDDDAVQSATVTEGKYDAGPLKLAGHAVYGMGKQVVVLTIGSAVGELQDWADDPLTYYADRIPGIAQAKQVYTAPETVPAYYQMAATLVPAKWHEFLASKDTDQAEMIGATAATIGVLLAPMAKGTGSAAADRLLARWTKLKGDVLAKGLKDTKRAETGALSLADDAAAAKKGELSEPVATPVSTPHAAATPRVGATPVPTPARRIAVAKTKGVLSKETTDIPHTSTKDIVPPEELRSRFPNEKLSNSEMRAMLADEREGRQLLATNEKQTRNLVGQSKGPNGNDPATADFVLKGRTEKGIVPVETKAQNEVNLIDEGSSALSKFEAMSKGSNATDIEHFELRIRTDTELPGDFMVEPETGRLWRRYDSNDYYEPWEVGGKSIFVKRSALGRD